MFNIRSVPKSHWDQWGTNACLNLVLCTQSSWIEIDSACTEELPWTLASEIDLNMFSAAQTQAP